MKVNRFVLDSNVLIRSALTPKSNSRKLINLIRFHNNILLFSEETFSEINTRIMRSKFDKYVTKEARISYIKKFITNYKHTKFISINNVSLGCRDSDDDKFLETALIGSADYIITYDNDLLVMKLIYNITIIKPEEFIEI